MDGKAVSTASAFELLQQVRLLGGSIKVTGGDIEIAAPSPLPEELLSEIREQKPAVMVALGAPFDDAVASILNELRPNLPPGLKNLPDSKLLVMVNWSIMAAWQKTIQKLGRDEKASDRVAQD